jgi:hypothetical protein
VKWKVPSPFRDALDAVRRLPRNPSCGFLSRSRPSQFGQAFTYDVDAADASGRTSPRNYGRPRPRASGLLLTATATESLCRPASSCARNLIGDRPCYNGWSSDAPSGLANGGGDVSRRNRCGGERLPLPAGRGRVVQATLWLLAPSTGLCVDGPARWPSGRRHRARWLPVFFPRGPSSRQELQLGFRWADVRARWL